MAKCECGSNKFITLEGTYIDLYPDGEPYEDGVYEDLTEDDKNLLDEIEVYVNMNICRQCKKIFFYINDEEYIKKRNNF